MKKNIMVVFGGESPEYDVSLMSATGILNNIPDKYEVTKVGVTKEGKWYRYTGSIEAITANTWFEDKAACHEMSLSLSQEEKGFIDVTTGKPIETDGVLILIHGPNGEDGTLQGMLELCNIPVIGCGSLSSALCMDKKRAHQVVNSVGVQTTPSVLVTEGMDLSLVMADIQALNFPIYVKPVKSGSSFGLSKLTDLSSLEEAVKYALEFDDEAVIEEGVEGIEVGCAIVGKSRLLIGEVDEIDLKGSFFDYEEKYGQANVEINVPARFNPAFRGEIAKTAVAVYRALGCSGFARVDLFVREDGAIFFNEVNTIPGCTPLSRFPKMLDAIGIDYVTMIDKIIEAC